MAKRRHIGSKSPSASASGSTTNSDNNTSGLRRSSRETPTKKQTPSPGTSTASPVTVRKSERIEKLTPSTPTSNKISDKLGSTKKNDEDEGENENVNETTERKPVRIVMGKKRLDARSYRQSLLSPQVKKVTSPESVLLTEKLKKKKERVQGDSDRVEAADVPEGSGRSEEEVGGNINGESSDRVPELTKSESGKSKIVHETELSQPRGKRKLHSDEFHESNNGCGSEVSRSSHNSLQSSPGVSPKEAVNNAEKVQDGCSSRENLQKVPQDSTSERRSVSGDVNFEKVYTFGTSKKKRKAEELESDVSTSAANETIDCSADPVISPSSENRRGNLEKCDACSKRQRSGFVSKNMCFCKYRGNHDTFGCSSSEETREQAAIVQTPENGPICVIKDCSRMNIDHSDNQEDVDACGSLPEPARNYSHDKTDLCATVEISNPLEEDGIGVMPGPCVGIKDKMPLKESPSGTNTDYDLNACVVCKLGGKLLCCDGKNCKKNYHLSCLNPPLKVFPPGVWHCFQCIKRKIHSGVHSVSEGVESICDVREEEVPDCEGIQTQKQYLVKYKGLAHVYNRWIPEHQLLLEVPSLVNKLKRNQVLKWKPEWTKPQRLLHKRALISPNERDESFSDCQHEWCVKWCGLGYEHATWELENAPFLRSPEVIPLIRDFERRLEKAIWASNPSTEKLLEEKKSSLPKLSKLPSGNISGLDNDYLIFVNKLREYWRRNQNAVVLEDQERIQKVVSFILSLQSDVCRPFLIISTSGSISFWEKELMQAAPSVNFVTYSGTREVRESIRALEFYEDGGCVMLQVLLSPIDAVIEDLEALELIGWEAIIVDECQLSRMSIHFEQIKKLTFGFRLLLLSGPVKESIAEYLNLLSFVGSGADCNADVSVIADSIDTISKLKENFARFVACGRKSDSAKFVEYWVPVQLSNVQLEQYCWTLYSNSNSLRSCSKSDTVGALRDILISLRKCCDHPFLVDTSLQNLLTKDIPEVDHLDIGVKASGKLQVLDKILSEIKRRGLRVLILFQKSGGSGRNLIGDYLDDFLRQRFGPDSYERVDSLLVNSKKQAALNMFNNKERGRFVFLIENRACLPSIKLSSVDMAILFDSDLNPLNDLRALQKISIDSQFEQLNVFRLYSPCTVEEKVLSFAKQDLVLDSNIQNISCSTSHALLFWGAHYQFHKMDEFHNSGSPSIGSNVEPSVLNDLAHELLNQIPSDSEVTESTSCKFLLKAHQGGASYSKDITLVGEKEMQSKGDELPHVLWTNLFEGRHPRWRYISASSQRVRKKVQYFDELPRKPQENDEATKKRKKVVGNTVDPNIPKSPLDTRRKVVTNTEGASGTPGTPSLNVSKVMPSSTDHITPSLNASKEMPSSTDHRNSVKSSVSNCVRDSRKSLHLSLKPIILKLCEILQFQDDVKNMAERLLEYIVYNFTVTQEPVSVYQAFQISLCCSAASLSNIAISRKKALLHVKEHLDFQCKEGEIHAVDSVLRDPVKKFCTEANSSKSVLPGNSSSKDREKPSLELTESQSALSTEAKHGESILAEKSFSEYRDKPSLHLGASQLSAHQELEEGEIRESPQSLKFSIHLGSSQQEVAVSGNASGSSKSEPSKSIKQVRKTHKKRMKKIYQKQIEEINQFNISREKIVQKDIEKLEKKHKLESALIRSLHNQPMIRSEKQKKVDQELERQKKDLNERMEREKKKLEAMQRQARAKEKEMETHWIQEVKFGRSASAYAMLPLSESGFSVEYMEEHGQVAVSHEHTCPDFRVEHDVDCEENDGEKSTTSPSPSLQKQDADGVMTVVPEETLAVENCDTICGDKELVSTETMNLATPFSESDVIGNTRSMTQTKLCNSGSPSLGKSLLCSGSDRDQDQADHSQDDQVPSLQAPIIDCTRSSVPTVGLESVRSPCEAQNVPHADSQTLPAADSHAFNQVNDVTLVLPPDEPLRQFAPTNPLVTRQCQPGLPAYTLVEQVESNEPGQSLEAPTGTTPVENQCGTVNHSSLLPDSQTNVEQSTTLEAPTGTTPVENQCGTVDHSSPLPDNQINNAAPQQFGAPALLVDISSAEHNQRGALANTSVDQSVPLPDNLLSRAGPEQSQVPNASAESLSTEQIQPQDPPSTCADQSTSLQANQISSAVSQQTQVTASLIDPLLSAEESVRTCIGRGQRNGPLQHFETQVPPPQENQNELFNQSNSLANHPARHTATQLAQLPPHLPMEQNNLLRNFVSQRGDQTLLNLSDSRNARVLPDMTSPPPPTIPASSRVPQHSLEPLLNELGRIRREEEHTIKKHEDEKMRLHVECEKEIEEIRKKYNALLQEAEREFMQKKKTLETNQNIVNMNQILAVAFRLKCESKTTGSPGVQQGAPGSTQPQVIHSSPQVAERPTSVPGPSTATHTTPLQMVHQPSALFSSNPVRSQVSQAHMPSKNHQIGTELRAPAPHLQPFRPVTSMSAPCFSTPVQPGQQSLNPIRTQFAPSQPTQMPGSFSRVHQSDNTAGVRNTHTHSLSALQLLIDMDRRPSARPQTLFPPVQAVGQFSDTWNIPEQRMTANLCGTGIRSAAGNGTLGDVVCLSDDD